METLAMVIKEEEEHLNYLESRCPKSLQNLEKKRKEKKVKETEYL